MGFLCEAPQGVVHNHWARPQPRQACPSDGGKVVGAGCSPSFYSFFPSCCSSVLLLLTYLFSMKYPPTIPTHSPPSFFLCPLLRTLWCVHMLSSYTCTRRFSEQHFHAHTEERGKSKRLLKKRGLKKNWELEGEESESLSLPHHPLPCGSGMWPLFSVLNKPFK